MGGKVYFHFSLSTSSSTRDFILISAKEAAQDGFYHQVSVLSRYLASVLSSHSLFNPWPHIMCRYSQLLCYFI